MGDVVDLNGQPIPLGDDISPELVADLARYAEGVLTEAFVRRKYRFDESTWERLGDDDTLVEAIETEKIRRIRDGSTKREKSQQRVTQAPDVLNDIMLDANASPRHRVDAAKALDAFAANGPEAKPASDRFQITINLGADHTERFSKSIEINANDTDPDDDVDLEVQRLLTAVATTNKPGSDGGGEPL